MYGSNSVTPAPTGRDEPVPSSRPTVLYEGDSALVTTGYFESGGLRFPVAGLFGVERVEHGGMLQARRYELWALFQGQSVRLFRSQDAREFGQVCRALTRAREHAGLS